MNCGGIRPALFLCATLVLALVGCQPANKFIPPPPPKVTVAKPVQREVVEYLEFTGVTRAAAAVELRARVNGYLEAIKFVDGATVKQGDVLFVIDQGPYRAELQSAEAAFKKAQAMQLLAEANLKRTQTLFGRNATTKEALEVDQSEQASAAAEVAAAQAAVDQAKLNISYTEIRAPLSGRIGRHLVDAGNLVLSEQTLLARIESIDPIQVYFNISESEWLRMQQLKEASPPSPGDLTDTVPLGDTEGAKVEMSLGDSNDFDRVGQIDFRDFGVDVNTGTIQRRGVFANSDQALVPGLFVRVRMAVGAPRSRLLVEERAIAADQRGEYVLVVNDKNIVEYRPVKLGTASDGLRVIESGVQPDEWVVVNGIQRARPEAQVVPEQAVMAALRRVDRTVK